MPVCNEAGCRVLIDGKCLERVVPPVKCPHFKEDNENNISESSVAKESSNLENDDELHVVEPETFIPIYSGEALSSTQCDAVMGQSLTRLILLGGLADSGKTTTIITLFDLFQQGPFAGYNFSGSQTLIGFEKRSHDSRIASNRSREETLRTTLATAESYLHLQVNRLPSGKRVDLLLADISGEFFKILRNSTSECKKFIIAQRADHFALFLDTSALSDVLQRQQVKSASLGVLRSLVEAEMISSTAKIQIIFSRWDLAASDQHTGTMNPFFESIKEEVTLKWPKLQISFHNIASRPAVGSAFDFGYGLQDLLPLWVEYSQFNGSLIGEGEHPSDQIASEREFLKYTVPNQNNI